MSCSIWHKVELWRINSPGSSRRACRNTAQWAEVCSVQTCPTAPQLPLSHWWSCPSDGHVRHAAYQTAGQKIILSTKAPYFIKRQQQSAARQLRAQVGQGSKRMENLKNTVILKKKKCCCFFFKQDVLLLVCSGPQPPPQTDISWLLSWQQWHFPQGLAGSEKDSEMSQKHKNLETHHVLLPFYKSYW